jgi:hypothetical protein
LSYVNCLEIQNRPDDNTLKRHMKRAIKANSLANALYMSKVETMMDREPPMDFATFCQGLLRKHEEHLAEVAQEAALNTDLKQQSTHNENESESANFSQGKGGRGGKGSRRGGKGGRGRGGKMGKGQTDARIGALSYGKGGFAADSYYDHGGASQQPFFRAGFRQNGGRGYGIDRQQGSDNKRAYQSAGGKDSNYYSKPKFDGYCNKCGNHGHKQIDCYAKKFRK